METSEIVYDEDTKLYSFKVFSKEKINIIHIKKWIES